MLREIAYEIVIGACRISGAGRPLTYDSNNISKGVSRSSSLTTPRSRKNTSLFGSSKVKSFWSIWKTGIKLCMRPMVLILSTRHSSQKPTSTVIRRPA